VDALIDEKSVYALKTGRIVDRTERGPLKGDCRTMTEPRSRGNT
jgi:hypothetical protein